MVITLHTEGWYDAAHHLENYEGKCANLHGHTYKVEVWVKGGTLTQLDKTSILWDFGKLKKITDKFDHKNLDNIYVDKNSTAENQCIYIYKELHEQDPYLRFKVRVYEQLAPKESWAEVGDFT